MSAAERVCRKDLGISNLDGISEYERSNCFDITTSPAACVCFEPTLSAAEELSAAALGQQVLSANFAGGHSRCLLVFYCGVIEFS